MFVHMNKYIINILVIRYSMDMNLIDAILGLSLVWYEPRFRHESDQRDSWSTHIVQYSLHFM